VNKIAAENGVSNKVTPAVAKYTGVLAAADVYTESTAFWVMESMGLDLGIGSQVHPSLQRDTW
jgi:hypothetical protein